MIDELILVRPNLSYEDQIKNYRNEFINNNDSMDGTASLNNYINVKSWLTKVNEYTSKLTCPIDKVVADTYLCVRLNDNKLVGMINIRHELNDYLLKFGGHIGYSVLPSERRKGYGKLMLSLALERTKQLGLNKVLITCNKNNVGSKNIIVANGGVYENSIDNDGIMTDRFWVEV